MQKAILAVLAVGILAAVCWAGGDPWKDKPYTQWDEKDIQRVMTSSPWMRSVLVVAAWKPADYDLPGDNPHPAQQQAQSYPASGGMGGKPGSGGGSNGAGSGGADSAPSIPQAEFAVYWMSSRTMREALGRRQMLHGGKDPGDVEKFVNQPLEEYEIVVEGRDMAPFVNNDEKFFQSNAFLEIKKSKGRVMPSHVTFERGANGKTVTGASFFFPKKSTTGENIVAPDEKSVQFGVSLGKSNLKVDFDPRKMDDQKGPDL